MAVVDGRAALAAPPNSGEANPYANLPGVDELDELPGKLEGVSSQASAPQRPAPPEAKPSAAPSDDAGQSALDDLAAERAGYDTRASPVIANAGTNKSQGQSKAKGARSKNQKGSKKSGQKWVRHEVIPGERLDEIAIRYGVRKDSLIRWNKLNAKKPMLRAGQKLKVYAKLFPPQRDKLTYIVKRGDTWGKIAKAHGVDEDRLRKRWNRGVPRRFKAGTEITVWVEPVPEEEVPVSDGGASSPASSKAKAQPLPLEHVRRGAISIGRPNRGKIRNAVQMPSNKKLYTLRKPEVSWGSTHTIKQLQEGIAIWRRDSGYTGDLVLGAISRKTGGRFRPHSSHQSGRDVDIRLPLAKGISKGTRPSSVAQVDWVATWKLIKTLIDAGEVDYIFLDYGRQKALHRAAKRSGATKKELERAIQYPRAARTNNGIVRHSKGHTAHIHVRFTCADYESNCQSY
jgi:murein endopeptidase/nucleoid-associated protein YgaU